MEEFLINPTPDSQSPTGVYIPVGLLNCFYELDKMIPTSLRKQIQDSSETDLSQHHFDLCMWMRNNWGYGHLNPDLNNILLG